MTLPAKWENIKHTVSYHIEGTRDADTHPDNDEPFLHRHHTHCSRCDSPFDLTIHFYGDGMICKKCVDDKFPNLEEIKKEIKELK